MPAAHCWSSAQPQLIDTASGTVAWLKKLWLKVYIQDALVQYQLTCCWPTLVMYCTSSVASVSGWLPSNGPTVSVIVSAGRSVCAKKVFRSSLLYDVSSWNSAGPCDTF